MTRLIEKYIPADERSSFCFEARDILSGSCHFDDREKWPVERRMAILDELATIPTEMEIPTLFGLADRRKHQWMDVAENTEMGVLRIAPARHGFRKLRLRGRAKDEERLQR